MRAATSVSCIVFSYWNAILSFISFLAKINETDTFGPGDDDEIQFDDIGDDDEDIDDVSILLYPNGYYGILSAVNNC